MGISEHITLVIGGCRSGKSSHALKLAEEIPGNRKIFVATCVPYDDEMKARVEKHRKERTKDWFALEVPIKIAETISHHSADADVILADCLTLWASNLLMENDDPETIAGHIRNLTQALEHARCPVILVSNEVGCGIVPENKLARQFRDVAGAINQAVAAIADRVIWTVAGIPVIIKPQPA